MPGLTSPTATRLVRPLLPFGRPAVRWAGLVGLLLGEVVALSLRFDTESLERERSWWADLIGEAHYLPQVALTVGVAVLVFAGGRVRRELAALGAAAGRGGLSWPVVGLQLGAFLVFALLTYGLIEGDLRRSPAAGLWGAAWVAACVLTGALWCAAVLPPRVWWRLLRRGRGGLALAAGVAVAALAASRFTESLWATLGDGTLWAVERCLRALFADVVIDHADRIVGTAAYSVRVGPACSGYEGLGLVLAFLGCYLWLCRATLRFPHALLLIPVGLAVAWTANVARIVALVAIGTWGWPEVARGGFHSQAGWLAFNVVALGLIGLCRISPLSRKPAAEDAEETEAGGNPAAPYLVPLVVIVGTGMVTGMLSADGFDRLYPLRVLAAAVAVWAYRRHYATLGWSWSWAAVGVGLAVFAAWIGLEQLLGDGSADSGVPAGFARLSPAEAAVWLVARILGAVVTVPLAEELAFRGYLLPRLQGNDPAEGTAGRWSWFAVLVSSLLFGVLHPGRWVAGTVAGVAYAWVFYRRGRLADAVVAHATTNAVLAAYVLATGSWGLW